MKDDRSTYRVCAVFVARRIWRENLSWDRNCQRSISRKWVNTVLVLSGLGIGIRIEVLLFRLIKRKAKK